ncbi:uncharacterized protein LOC116024177 [Ipomoea triloba]|uniref:uncharacterized protein LOC116024177 n=1 Tax=Ipomoea triloba TaxID=35885 RepID=UPI00125D4EF5|nr:uncharacterized protein LOC116024177 [Ipomoea triloba]
MTTENSLSTQLNSEEKDQLDRSKKKTKTSTESPMGEATPTREAMPTQGASMEKQPGALSFKQIVANESHQSSQVTAEDIDLVSDDEVDKSCPIIRLTREEKVRLRSKWKQTLIVKVLGRNVGYGYLLRRLTTLWKPKARMELVTVDNGYFLVKFASVDDYEFAKYGGPWMVLDHYLIVKEWVPNFDPFTAKTESMIVWIRFPCLPAEYFNHKFLMSVGEKVDRPINIDTATSLVSRASFARVCVEVDITKPLLAKFTLRNRVRPIVYEGLHLICFKCGTYGHNAEGCRLNCGEETIQTPTVNDGQRPETTSGTCNGQKTNGNGKELLTMETTAIRPELTEDYGTWMVAPKPKRNYTKNQGNKNQGSADGGRKDQQEARKGKNHNEQSGSRFANLADTTNEEDDQSVEELMGEQVNKQSRAQVANNSRQSKGKRPTAQVSKKQIEGNNLHGMHKRQPESGEPSTRRSNNKRAHQVQNNRAGAASEHTLVMGDKNGPQSVQVFETEVENDPECMGGTTDLHEHHGDPPDDDFLDAQEQTDQHEGVVCFGDSEAAAMEFES